MLRFPKAMNAKKMEQLEELVSTVIRELQILKAENRGLTQQMDLLLEKNERLTMECGEAKENIGDKAALEREVRNMERERDEIRSRVLKAMAKLERMDFV